MAESKESTETHSDLRMLDDLCRTYYKALLKEKGKNAKIGDFIKMVELRRKLAPADADQRKFWEMLDKVRQDTLGKPKKRTAKRRKKAKS